MKRPNLFFRYLRLIFFPPRLAHIILYTIQGAGQRQSTSCKWSQHCRGLGGRVVARRGCDGRERFKLGLCWLPTKRVHPYGRPDGRDARKPRKSRNSRCDSDCKVGIGTPGCTRAAPPDRVKRGIRRLNGMRSRRDCLRCFRAMWPMFISPGAEARGTFVS